MSTFVSKNALSPLIRFPTVKLEAARQRAPQLSYPFQSFLGAAIAGDLEFTFPRDSNFDLVALFEIEGFDNR